MPLIKCPDCGKNISDQASTCLGCGREMSVAIENEKNTMHSSAIRKGELIGFLIILASMGGCTIGMVSTGMSVLWFGIGCLGFLIGIVVFITGRFEK